MKRHAANPDEKKRAVARLRRIKGQAEALERAVESGVDCSALLQQIAALRGAANGLMAEVLEAHVRDEFGADDARGQELLALLRSYIK